MNYTYLTKIKKFNRLFTLSLSSDVNYVDKSINLHKKCMMVMRFLVRDVCGYVYTIKRHTCTKV